jgi:hypothetical protein
MTEKEMHYIEVLDRVKNRIGVFDDGEFNRFKNEILDFCEIRVGRLYAGRHTRYEESLWLFIPVTDWALDPRAGWWTCTIRYMDGREGSLGHCRLAVCFMCRW